MDHRATRLTPRVSLGAAALLAVPLCAFAAASMLDPSGPTTGVGEEVLATASPADRSMGLRSGYADLDLPDPSAEGGVGRTGLMAAVTRLGGGLVRAQDWRSATSRNRPKKPYHELFFTRAIYPLYSPVNYRSRNFGNRGRCGNHRWCTDWPEADEHFSAVIDRSLDVDVYIGENAMDLDDPELRRFPFLYIVEPGYMVLTEEQREGLRSFLLQGGFLMLDDFWGTAQYANFAWQMSLLLPEYEIVELPMDHPLLSAVYEIDEIIQVPNIYNYRDGTFWEEDGYEPWVHAIFDEDGRLLVVANAHTDIGDGMEHADDPFYSTEYSTYAFFMVMNTIVYAMAN